MIKERRTAAMTRVLYYRAHSAGSRLSPEDLSGARIAEASLLHVTGITPALSDSAAATAFAAIDEARTAGVPVSFDVNHRASLWRDRDAGGVYRRIAELSDLLFAGEEEARLVTGTDSPPAGLLTELSALGPEQVVLKLGDRGCIAWIDGTVHRRDAVPIDPVDTVGAGDAFVGAYLAGFVTGAPVAERLATAVAAGAFACLHPGDWEGYPRRSELALLDRSDPVER
jgi:2-dehydro-3-deoxygluconokinase